MNTIFHTNIDVAQRFMGTAEKLYGGCQIFFIGDDIVVHEEPGTQVRMRVVSRTWKFKKDDQPTLHVELHLSSGFQNVSQFETFLKSRGFR